MSAVLWSSAAMVGASVPVAWWAFSTDRPSSERVSQNLAGHNPTLRQAALQRSAVERLVAPLIRHVGRRLLRFTPIGWAGNRNLALAKAGLSGRLSAEQILGAKVLISSLLALTLGLRIVGGDARPRSVLLVVVATAAGFFAPDILIRARTDRRAESITRALPDLLDQVTISVEAGLGFEAALARTSRGPTSVLAQEFLRMLQDIRLGSTRSGALEALAERSQVEDLKTVVLALRQADALGVPLAATLRTLSVEMREKRRFRAEERAQRLPTLMIFPLGLCILPALFIVILGPAMMSGSGLP
ncbi:MAG: type II secretion system F family protein [Acidimicrobiia bacterium]|nr:type II secretion system F family protein [Acidimicrobiia bacterium]MDH5290886.1 type II secretion system F family protein [Acidimicrobiia bacterium]